MSAMADPIKIPIFPLSIVVFPGEELRLHIFEPRYKQLILDCKETGISFGIIPVIQKQLMTTGTLVKLSAVTKLYEDGRSDIILQSLGLFRILEVFRNYNRKLYSAASVDYFEIDNESNPELLANIKSRFEELCEINKVRPYKTLNWSQLISFDLGHYVGFSLAEEYKLLNMPSEIQRLEFIEAQINTMIGQSEVRAHWLKQIQMNGEFQNFNSEEWK